MATMVPRKTEAWMAGHTFIGFANSAFNLAESEVVDGVADSAGEDGRGDLDFLAIIF